MVGGKKNQRKTKRKLGEKINKYVYRVGREEDERKAQRNRLVSWLSRNLLYAKFSPIQGSRAAQNSVFNQRFKAEGGE